MKTRILICSLLLMAVLSVYSNDTYAYPGGLLNGRMGFGQASSNLATDGNNSTFVNIPYGCSCYIAWSLPGAYHITKVKLDTRIGLALTVRYTYADGTYKQIGYTPSSRGQEWAVNEYNVTSVYAFNFVSGFVNPVYEFDVFGNTDPPETPVNLTASAGDRSLTVNWQQVEMKNVDGFNVYVDGVKANPEKIGSLERSYVVNGLDDGTTYSVQVSSVGLGDVESARSDPVSVKTFPSVVKPLLSYNPSVHDLVLNWDAVGVSYEVWKRIDGVDSKLITTSYLSYKVTDLQPESDIDLYVVSIDQYGRRVQSDILTATTLPLPPVVVPTLSYTSSYDSVTLKWNPVGVSYEVWNRFEGADYQLTTTSQLSYKVTGLQPDSEIDLYVVVIDQYGRRGQSDVLTATTLVLPPVVNPVLNYTNLSSVGVRLTWDNVGEAYRVYQDGAQIAQTSFAYSNVSGLQPDTDYVFKVAARDAYGRWNESTELSLHTLTPAPDAPAITISDVRHDGFRASWLPDPKATGFEVYLGSQLVQSGLQTSFDFTGLAPYTMYTVKIVAKGTSDVVATVAARTNRKDVPVITSASVSPVSGDDPSKRKLTYEANDMVTGVKLYVNGELIGEYPSTQKTIDLDYADLGITGQVAELELVPTDPEGVPFKFSSLASTTGNLDFDDILAPFLSMFGMSRSAFMMLALAALPLTVFVLLYFWTRRKAKRLVGGSAPDSSSSTSNAPKKPYKPWSKMTDSERLEYRSNKHYERTGYKIKRVTKHRESIGFLGLGGERQYEKLTYERNGVEYKTQYVRGKGRVYVPKDARNQLLHVKIQITNLHGQLLGGKKSSAPNLPTIQAPPARSRSSGPRSRYSPPGRRK